MLRLYPEPALSGNRHNAKAIAEKSAQKILHSADQILRVARLQAKQNEEQERWAQKNGLGKRVNARPSPGTQTFQPVKEKT
jgi:hypothetical protein